MAKPLDASHFKAPARPVLAANPAITKLAGRLAEGCRAGFARIRPAPWRVTFERITEGEAVTLDGEGGILRFESELGSLTSRLTLDRQSISALLEAAMGGTGAEAAFSLSERPLSKLELAILRLAETSLARELATALSDQFDRPFSLFEGREEPDLPAAASDLAQMQFTVNVFSYSGDIRLCFQRSELERQVGAGSAGLADAADGTQRERLQQEVGKSEVTLTISLGPEVLPLETIAGLSVGKLVELSSRVTAPVIVWSGGVAAYEAVLARSGERLAITISGPAS